MRLYRGISFSKMHKRVGYLGIENQQDSVYEDRWGFMDMSNMTKNNKIIACIKMVIGISMPIAVLIGYLPIPEWTGSRFRSAKPQSLPCPEPALHHKLLNTAP